MPERTEEAIYWATKPVQITVVSQSMFALTHNDKVDRDEPVNGLVAVVHMPISSSWSCV